MRYSSRFGLKTFTPSIENKKHACVYTSLIWNSRERRAYAKVTKSINKRFERYSKTLLSGSERLSEVSFHFALQMVKGPIYLGFLLSQKICYIV
ncbi:hypothetical protein FKM82_013452 [Ascaphus truei]